MTEEAFTRQIDHEERQNSYEAQISSVMTRSKTADFDLVQEKVLRRNRMSNRHVYL